MKFFKEYAKAPLILFITCVLITTALAVTNYFTKDKIAAIEVSAEQQAMKTLIEADNFEKAQTQSGGENLDYYKAVKDGSEVGFVFVTTDKGYGGDIKVMSAIDLDGKIIAIEVLAADNETPGLGANCLKQSFWDSFKGKENSVSVKKDGGEIDALTGATISSRAVANAVNKALTAYNEIK